MPYQILFTPQARQMLSGISDRRIQAQIVKRAEQLVEEPEKQGRPLAEDLTGYRSVRAVGQRYRIIYQVENSQVRVLVIAAGIRRDGDRHDIYTLAQRLVRLGLIEPPE